ncbi:hypothetical protein SteCoe_10680 [Stentor coeruleus]|uniref:Uncharacterized protein n=1 Tax=Stentor coeruleus TaxID=5963 RepID=A0A1R2CEZ8_9CILI|nr:hypothetical protein SteCoe_10680 [Stentor coeruleus]
MFNRNHIEGSYVTIKYRQSSLLQHYERLREIKNSIHKKRSISFVSIGKNLPHREIERTYEIEKSNKVLLNKLIEINTRKYSEIKSNLQLSRENIKKSAQVSRARRLLLENLSIAKRIIKQKPLITKKILEKDFELHKKYSQLLSRKHLLKLNGNLHILPSVYKRKYVSKTPPPIIKSEGGITKNSEKSLDMNMKDSIDLTIEDDSSVDDVY